MEELSRIHNSHNRSIEQGNRMASLSGHPDWEFYVNFLKTSIERMEREMTSPAFSFKRVTQPDGTVVTEPLRADQIAVKHSSLAGELRGLKLAINTPDRFIKERDKALKKQEELNGARASKDRV